MAAKSPGGKEVGRISIRVVPDTTRFYSRLKNEMEALEKTLKGEIGVIPDMDGFREEVKAKSSGITTKVRVDADTNPIETKLQQLSRKAANTSIFGKLDPAWESRAKQQLKEAEKLRDTQAKISGSIAEQKLKELQAEQAFHDKMSQHMLDQQIKALKEEAAQRDANAQKRWAVDEKLAKHRDALDMASLRKQHAEAMKTANEMTRQVESARQGLQVDLDKDHFRRSMLAETQRLSKEIELKIPLTADGERMRTKVKAQVEALEHSIRAEIPVHLKMAAGQRAKIAAEIAALEKTAGKLDKRGNFLTRGFSSAMDGLARASTSAMNALSGTSDAALIFLAVAAIGAPAIGVLTTGLLALPGILAGIALPIGTFILGLDGIKKAASVLKEPFGELKKVISDTFETKLTPVFEQLKTLFPTLQAELPKVASAMSNAFEGITNVLTSDRGKSQISAIIDNLAAGIDRAVPGVQAFTQAILNLVEQVSTKFPAMADGINTYGARFLNWVNEITTKGPDGLSQFDKAMSGFGETLKGVVDAIAIIGDGAIKMFSDPKFRMYLSEFIEDLKKIATVVIPLLKGGFEVFTQILNGLVVVIDGVSSAFDTMSTGIQRTADLVRNVWADAPAAVTGAWDAITNAVSGSISQLVSTIADGGSQILTEVASWPGKIVAALGDMPNLLVAAGKALMDGLLNGIKAGFQAVMNFVGTIAGTIASLKGPLPYDRVVLKPNGEALMQGLGDGLTSGFENILTMAKDMARQISQAMSDGTDLSGMLGGNKFPDLTKMLDTIEQERKSLKVQLDNTADKGMKSQLRDQMRQLQLVKDQLSLDKDKLKNAQKYGGELANQVGKQDDLGQKIWDAGVNLGKATKDQLMSDLNIGGGAVSNLGDELMNWGLNAGKKFIFNVNSMDDALAGQRNLVNREALQFDRR